MEVKKLQFESWNIRYCNYAISRLSEENFRTDRRLFYMRKEVENAEKIQLSHLKNEIWIFIGYTYIEPIFAWTCPNLISLKTRPGILFYVFDLFLRIE